MEDIEDSALWSMGAKATLRLGTIQGNGQVGEFPTVILTIGASPLGTDLFGAMRTVVPEGQYLFRLAPWVAEALSKQLAQVVADMPDYPKQGN